MTPETVSFAVNPCELEGLNTGYAIRKVKNVYDPSCLLLNFLKNPLKLKDERGWGWYSGRRECTVPNTNCPSFAVSKLISFFVMVTVVAGKINTHMTSQPRVSSFVFTTRPSPPYYARCTVSSTGPRTVCWWRSFSWTTSVNMVCY